jgi:hypothetical protein
MSRTPLGPYLALTELDESHQHPSQSCPGSDERVKQIKKYQAHAKTMELLASEIVDEVAKGSTMEAKLGGNRICNLSKQGENEFLCHSIQASAWQVKTYDLAVVLVGNLLNEPGVLIQTVSL